MTNEALIYNDAAVRERYRTGAVDVAAAAEDSGLCETPHIADTDAWIAMDDKEREAYSATAGEIHGQASFVGKSARCFSKIWDSIGLWIATRTAVKFPRNIQAVAYMAQTFSVKEEDEKKGAGVDEGINDKHCSTWLKKFENWLYNAFKN